MNLQVYRGASVIAEIPIKDNFMFSRTLMQEHRITIPGLVTTSPLPIQINDYITHKGIKYTINTIPDLVVTHNYTYGIIFEGPEYKLLDKLFMDEGASDFPYFGTALEHLQLLVDNINEIDPGWTVGIVDETEPQFVDYVNYYCRTALSTMAEKFRLEYYFNNKQINLVKQAGNVTTYSFAYGIYEGLYSLGRKYVSEKNVKTKVFGFGSTRNLTADYRGGITKGRLTFDERFITRNVDIYGTKEAPFTDEEIYPYREAPITAASAVDDETTSFTVSDSTLDFNLNDYKIPGLEGKIQFITGELTGEEFVITGYNNTTKTITLNAKTNSSGIKLPSSSFKAEIGDKFVILDLELPAPYIEAAELKLKNATTEFTDQVAIPKVEFELNMDLIYVRDNNVELNPGDKVQIVNPSLGINDQIRVLSVSYPISFPEVLNKETKYSVTIANFISYRTEERLEAVVIENRTNIKIVDRRSVEMARRNTANFRNLQDLIFDPDGYFDTGTIKPGSIESGMLSIVVRSQNFRLNDVVFQFNYEGDENAINVTNGTLEHLEIQIEGLGYSWVIPTKLFTGLDPLKPYYLYAQCSKSALTGEWMISDVPVFVEQDPGYYNFNIGIVYKVTDGYRDKDFTYGATTIVGENVKTGKLQDITEQNYLNLTTGQFNLGNEDSGIDYGVTMPETLTIRGTIIATLANFVNLFVKSLKTAITGKRIEISEEKNNIELYNSTDENILLIDDDSARDGGTYYTLSPPFVDLEGNYPKNYLYSFNTGTETRYYYAVMGPGVSVGISPTHSAGFSTMGRKGFVTQFGGQFRTENSDGSKYTFFNQNGFQTTEDLVVKGPNLTGTGRIMVGEFGTRAGLNGYVQIGATTGTRYPGMLLINGIPVEIGSYLTSEHPPMAFTPL